MQHDARGLDAGLSCGEPRQAPRRAATSPPPRSTPPRARLVVHSSRFCAHGKALAGASAACRQPMQHKLSCAKRANRSSVTHGHANAGWQRSCLRHAGVLVLLLRRSTQVQHVVAPAQARGEQHAVEQQQRHGAPDKHFAQVAGELPVDVFLGRSQLWTMRRVRKTRRLGFRAVRAEMQGQALNRAVNTACEAANTWRPTQTRARARACRFM